MLDVRFGKDLFAFTLIALGYYKRKFKLFFFNSHPFVFNVYMGLVALAAGEVVENHVCLEGKWLFI